jgi:tetratricopeptide (TPR) repeat protein
LTRGSQSAEPGHVATPEDTPDMPGDTALAQDRVPPAASQPGLPILPEAATQIDRAAPPPSPRRAEIARLTALASASFDAKDYAVAADLLAQILKLDPDSPPAHGNLAVAFWRTKHMARAEALCRRALALSPDYVAAHRLLPELLRERNDVDGAHAAYERLLQLDPGNFIALNNAGLMLRAARRTEEAEAHFARALALKPGDPTIRFNQLASRRDDTGLEEAIECCRRSLERTPDSSEVLTNLGVTLHFAGHFDEALTCVERAVALEPDNHQAHFNLAAILLLRGDFARGWREYEHRWPVAEVKKPEFRQPQWEGEDLAGKTILLQSEQGFGDTIQCLRYVPAIAARAGRVLLRTERGLVRLAASVPSNPVILPPDAAMPPFDVWCPLLSLPRIFGTLAHTIPADIPYLHPRAALAERWHRRLADLRGLKVGLVWGGNEKHANDFRRSIPFGMLAPILATAGASFASLQIGPRSADLATLPADTVADLAAELRDFAETAGAIANLDLVIAVDTAVAHAAGAMGRPVWLMLPLCPDWRWLLPWGDASPWYPTMRLYRQRKLGDWPDVVARVAADLGTLAAGHAGAADAQAAATSTSPA